MKTVMTLVLCVGVACSQVHAQGFTVKDDNLRADLNNVSYVQMDVKNFNTYKQQYKISVDGEFREGVLRLYPRQGRLIRVKLQGRGKHKVCLYGVPKKTQNRVLALCDTILVK